MRAIALAIALEIVSGFALAQGATDATGALGPARPATAVDNWILSATTSPVDYKPIVTATTFSRDGSSGSSMHLSIHCHSGRTELVVAGPAFERSRDGYAISYRINDHPPVTLAGASPLSGTGVAFTGDVVGLLQSFPEEGEVAIRLVSRNGTALEGHFLLAGLKRVRGRFAEVCKWPQAAAKPRG
ncbi:hypothetical protein [Bradyrhizobium ivorense]|uniref:hypothetical protein n=1 Tax=Bradyrhizobium ivorense TaxID=2511166 RepID=UPI0010AFD711|nr:hypothetical protein [Bradyrhizobium ivorense]VIO80196.1 hypothetical protein CI41S_71560 [Bradyrhizobium ivorense]